MNEKMVDLIKQRPDLFEVCQACGSILRLGAWVCPQCNAYNPLTGEALVLSALKKIITASRKEKL